MKIFSRSAFLFSGLLMPTIVECEDKSPCEEEALTLATCFAQTGAQCSACFANVSAAILFAADAEGDECLFYNEWICPSSSCCTDGCQLEFNGYMQCIVDENTEEPCTLLCADGGESDSTSSGSTQTQTPVQSPVKSDDSSVTQAPTQAAVAFTFSPDSPDDFDEYSCKTEEQAWEACIINEANAATCFECSEHYGTPSLIDLLSGNYCRAWTSWACPFVNCCDACEDQLEAMFQCEISNDPVSEDCELDCANYAGVDGINGNDGSGGSSCDAASWFLAICIAVIPAIFIIS